MTGSTRVFFGLAAINDNKDCMSRKKIACLLQPMVSHSKKLHDHAKTVQGPDQKTRCRIATSEWARAMWGLRCTNGL